MAHMDPEAAATLLPEAGMTALVGGMAFKRYVLMDDDVSNPVIYSKVMLADFIGAGAVTMGGVHAACKKTNQKVSDQMLVISGAGAGDAGVAWLLREALTPEQARAHLMALDSTGLLYEGRHKMEAYNNNSVQTAELAQSFAPDVGVPDLLQTIQGSKGGCLICLGGTPGQFTEEIVMAVATNCKIPLSNPNTNMEAFPKDIVKWMDNRALNACGSPFDGVPLPDGGAAPIGQGDNAFVFPRLGAGAVRVGATKITDMEGGYTVAEYCCEHWPELKLLYTPVSECGLLARKSPSEWRSRLSRTERPQFLTKVWVWVRRWYDSLGQGMNAHLLYPRGWTSDWCCLVCSPYPGSQFVCQHVLEHSHGTVAGATTFLPGVSAS